MSYSSILLPIGTEVLSGIISVIVWELLKRWRQSISYRKRYDKYVGNYLAFNKFEKESKDQIPVKYFHLTRKANKFIIQGKPAKSDAFSIHGEITMDSQMPKYGKGYYQHDYIKGDEQDMDSGRYNYPLNIFLLMK